MNKKFLSILFVSLFFLSACGGSEEPNTSETTQIEEEVVQETDENYNDYFLNDMKYTVLDSWTEDISDENLKYYYPENGMLMVSYSDEDGTISNNVSRSTFMDGFSESFESFDIISESEKTIAGKTAYQFEIDGVLNNEEIKITLIVFDYDEGIMLLVMGTYEGSDKDYYSSDFENVLNSIEFPEQTAEKEEVEEETEGDGIILGEPIDLDEYTLTIQNYKLSKDYDGNDALIIEYDWINNSEDTARPFMTFNIKGFQDGVETDYAIMVEGADLATSQKEIRPGGSIEGAQTTVSISDMNKPLEIELDESFSFNSEPIITEIDLSDLD